MGARTSTGARRTHRPRGRFRALVAVGLVALGITVPAAALRAQIDPPPTTLPPETVPTTPTTLDPTTPTTLDPTTTTLDPTTTTLDPIVDATAEEAKSPPGRGIAVYVGSTSRLSSAQRAAVKDYLTAADRLARARTAGTSIAVALDPTSTRGERSRSRVSTPAWRLAHRAAVITVERAAAGVTSMQQAEVVREVAEAEFARATAELQRVARGDPMITALLTGAPPANDGFGRRIVDAQAGQGNPPRLTGLVDYPVPGAPVVSRFGYRADPFSGDVEFHPGIDIGAAPGTPVRAAAAGTVLVAEDSGGYGKAVVLDHGSSLATVYGHLLSLIVAPGQRVAAGEVIGYVGSTGLSTGPHLHFEVRLRAVTVDPIPTLVG
ncbi:MAG: M23 family metallopeptidase [Actinomycetota bacterium]